MPRVSNGLIQIPQDLKVHWLEIQEDHMATEIATAMTVQMKAISVLRKPDTSRQ